MHLFLFISILLIGFGIDRTHIHMYPYVNRQYRLQRHQWIVNDSASDRGIYYAIKLNTAKNSRTQLNLSYLSFVLNIVLYRVKTNKVNSKHQKYGTNILEYKGINLRNQTNLNPIQTGRKCT